VPGSTILHLCFSGLAIWDGAKTCPWLLQGALQCWAGLERAEGAGRQAGSVHSACLADTNTCINYVADDLTLHSCSKPSNACMPLSSG
jgi:hypothetical protein